jgi:hypothetical protein
VAGDAWQTYRSDNAGYTVVYPASWRVAEQFATDGSGTTTFTPTSAGGSITVLARIGPPDRAVADTHPAVICTYPQPGRMTPAHCLDSIPANPAKVITGHGRTYTIITSDRGIDPEVFQRFVDSFTLLSP